jgi:acetolactate synthase-1/2/3 large subunit
MGEKLHGGFAVSRTLKALEVANIFTLSGGHIFPIFDGCHHDGIRIVDVRHEQNAVFAAEGWARLTRSLGVAAVTAGPGVTNAMSPMVQAAFNQAPVLVLAGRAPQFRWGQGSLQEIDHIPFVDPIATAQTVTSTEEIAGKVLRTAVDALRAPRGPRFLDFPLDVLFNQTDVVTDPVPATPSVEPPDVEGVAALMAAAERPVFLAGSNVWMDKAEGWLRTLAEKAGLPVFMNGQGRGCLPADHDLSFTRARGRALKEADLVIVAGTPMDFRLGFGQFGGAKVVHLESHPDGIANHVDLAGSVGAPLDATLRALSEAIEGNGATKPWLDALRETETTKEAAAEAELISDSQPIHPMRIYGELGRVLDRDAIVVCDGGDFVSYAGKEIASYEPGCWLDPGPFGCLGVGPGYALAARLAHPGRQVVILYGDGAIGFSGTELESFVRHGLPVVCVVGNNGIWGLEKHPMRALYGYDVAADLQPGIRYDRMMEAFGGKGETVTEPAAIGPALRRAFDSGEPYLVNVLTDPEIAYPRSSNLA